MVRIPSALAALLLLAACQPKGDDDATAIANVRTAWVNAWKTGNAAQLAELYHDDAVQMLNHTSSTQGKVALASAYGGQFAQVTPNDIVITTDKTEISGDLAYDYGTYQVSFTPKDGSAPISDSGRYLVVLKKDGEAWKIVAHMDNSPTPLQQPTQVPQQTVPQPGTLPPPTTTTTQ